MKKFITLLICICLSGVLMAQTSVRQVKAGGLLASLSDEDKDTITVLTLKGTMDARDFKTLRDSVLLLNWLDLSQVTIDAYSGSDGTINGATDTKSYDYPLNTIPQMAFLMPDSKAITGKTSLVKVILPNSATHVAEQAFAGCSALNELVIPSSIEHIGNDAFSACTSIQIVRAQGKNPINFYGQTSIFAKEIFATASVFVPQGAQKFYDTALVWKEFSNIVEPISISQSDFTVNAADTSRLNVTVSSNLKWIAKTNSAWLLVSPSDSVDGDKELEITVLPNTKIETRIDSILFVTKNLDSVYVRVNQEMSNPIIICSKSVLK